MLKALFLFASIAAFAQDGRQALQKVAGQNALHQSVSYRLDYRFKPFDSADTLRVPATCRMIRDPKEPIVHGRYLYDFRTPDYGHALSYFTGEALLFSQPDSCRTTRYTGDMLQMASDVQSFTEVEIGKIYFFAPERLLALTRDPKNKIVLEKLDARRKLAVVSMEIPEGREGVGNIVTFSIDTQRWAIRSMIRQSMVDGQPQYAELRISEMVFDKVTDQALQDKFSEMARNADVADYKPPNPGEFEMIADGAPVPDFSGTDLGGNDFALHTLLGKVVVLDFGFLGCQPCRQLVPALVRLQDVYGPAGVAVVSVNPVDKDLDKLRQFDALKAVSYKTVLTDKQTAKRLKVSGYPAVYVIDQAGKVLKSIGGYYDGMGAELEQAVVAALKR